MSLAVALEGADGVVLAADSRGTIGDPRGLTAINDAQLKLFKLTTFVGLCTFGSAEIGAEVARTLQARIQESNLGSDRVDAVAESTRQHARLRYDDWFERLDVANRPTLGLIVAGLQDDNKPRSVLLLSQLDFAPQPATAGFMAGGVPQYATYLVHRFYDRDKGVTALAHLAEYLISETASQDPKVGGPIKIALITAEEGYEELTDEQVAEIHNRNQAQMRVLRESFYQTEGGGEHGLDA